MKKLTLLVAIITALLANGQTKNPAFQKNTGNCHEDSIYFYRWNAANISYSHTGTTFYTYTSNDDLATERQVDFNDSIWANNYQSIHTYDANHNKTQTLNQTYSNNTWVNYGRLTYNTTGNVTEQINELWGTNNNWQNVYKITYIYDANHYLIQQINQNWVNTNWENTSQSSYTNSTNGKVLINTRQNWNASLNVWDNGAKGTYTYDSSHNPLTILWEGWNQSLSTWTNYEKFTNTYDANNNRLSTLYQNWNNALSNWDNLTRWTWTFNSLNQFTTLLWEKWNNNAWVYDEKRNQNYDVLGLVSVSEQQAWINNNWINSYKFDYYYNCSITGLITITNQPESLLVYPNPAQTSVFFNSGAESKVKVINMLGKIIKEDTCNGTLIVSDLAPGIYYMQTYDIQTKRLKIGRFIKD